MKRRRSRPRHRQSFDGGIYLTPMLDTVLNLLFFFLLTTTLRTDDTALKVSLPSAQTAAPVPEGGQPIVTIDQAGRIYFKGREVVEEELELNAIRLVKQGVSRLNIRGDASANFGRIVRVMDICKRAGLQEVLINADRGAEPPAREAGRP